MAPTLWGTHLDIQCDQCEFAWKVDASVQVSASEICPHCGHPLETASVSIPVAPNVVDLHRIEDLRIGQLVAIGQDGQLSVKRIVALAGDRVTVDRWRLLVNGQRMEDTITTSSIDIPLPEFVVDADALRDHSRWESTQSPLSWNRSPDREWNSNGDGTWLVYRHRSVHDHDRISAIMDDYPGNLDLQRKLFPVDRLVLTGDAHADTPVRLTVAFFSERGSRSMEVTLDETGSFRAEYRNANPSENLPVNEEQPAAIRVDGAPVDLSGIVLSRMIEYRVRPHDDLTQYPLTVPPDTIFVLGDNVPVSVDSRDYGPVEISNLRGIVRATK